MGKKGRRHHTPRFVMLTHSLIETAAWADLSGNAAKLLVHLIKIHDGTNNGKLSMGERSAAEWLGVARATATAAIDNLHSHKFIAMTGESSFDYKMRRPRTWRLTFLPTEGAGPTHDYKVWKPVDPE